MATGNNIVIKQSTDFHSGFNHLQKRGVHP